MGGDSSSNGRGFESKHHILDGHFSHLFVVKIVTFVWKDKNKQKKGRRDGPFFEKNYVNLLAYRKFNARKYL